MMNIKKIPATATFMFSLGFCATTNAQSLSDEIFKNVEGKRFWQVDVSCNNTTTTPTLTKELNSEQWCINNSTNCYLDKLQAAAQACNKSTQTPTTSSSIELNDDEDFDGDDDDDDELLFDYDALRQEKINLEAQRLQIQQAILNLKQKEIELKKDLSQLK